MVYSATHQFSGNGHYQPCLGTKILLTHDSSKTENNIERQSSKRHRSRCHAYILGPKFLEYDSKTIVLADVAIPVSK